MPKYNRSHYQEVTSTNDICFEKCKESEVAIVITADKQTRGRGRNQKGWKVRMAIFLTRLVINQKR